MRRPLPLVLLLLAFPLVLGSCRNPAADANTLQALTELGDEVNAQRQDAASLQAQIDSLRGALARQDTLVRRLAGMAGMPVQ